MVSFNQHFVREIGFLTIDLAEIPKGLDTVSLIALLLS